LACFSSRWCFSILIFLIVTKISRIAILEVVAAAEQSKQHGSLGFGFLNVLLLMFTFIKDYSILYGNHFANSL